MEKSMHVIWSTSILSVETSVHVLPQTPGHMIFLTPILAVNFFLCLFVIMSNSSLWFWFVWPGIHIFIHHIIRKRIEEYTIIIFIYNKLCSNIVSVNNRDTKDNRTNMLIPTMSKRLLLQLDIVTHSSLVTFNGTVCRIVYICWYYLRDI